MLCPLMLLSLLCFAKFMLLIMALLYAYYLSKKVGGIEREEHTWHITIGHGDFLTS